MGVDSEGWAGYGVVMGGRQRRCGRGGTAGMWRSERGAPKGRWWGRVGNTQSWAENGWRWDVRVAGTTWWQANESPGR